MNLNQIDIIVQMFPKSVPDLEHILDKKDYADDSFAQFTIGTLSQNHLIPLEDFRESASSYRGWGSKPGTTNGCKDLVSRF